MRRKYPKPENVTYLLCDQVRPELHKKMSLMGLYAGDAIVFQPNVPGQFPYTLAGLAFVYILKDGSGAFDAQFKMLDPKGNQIYDVRLEPITIDSGSTSGIIVQLGNVQFNSEGNYMGTLLLNKRRYDFAFRVSSDSAGQSS